MNDDKHVDFASLKYYDQRNKQYIDTKIDGLKTEFNDVERRVDTLEATSRGHDEQLIAHREELDDLEARVINLERDDVSIRQDIADLRVAVENSGGGTGGVTKDYVDNAIEDAIESLQIPDTTDFVTKEELAAEDFVTEAELTELTNTVASNQVAIEDLQENKANKSDLTGLATEEFVITKIAEAELNDKDVDLSQYYTKTEVDAKIPDVSNFATKDEIPVVPTKVSELENDAGYITAKDIPDTSVFVTNETLEEKNYITTAEATTQIEQIVEQKVTEAVTPDSINYDTWE